MDVHSDHYLKMLRRAENMSGIGHWSVDVANGHKVYWSQNIFRIHGLEPSDSAPDLDTAISFYHEDDRPVVLENIRKAFEEGEGFDFTLRLLCKDGKLRYVKSIAECEVDSNGNVTSVFGVFKDVTSYKIREIELQNTRDFLTLMMDNFPDLIFVKDDEFKIVAANPAFLSLYPEDERDGVIGTTSIEGYDPAEAEAFLKQDRIAFQKGYSEVFETITFPDGVLRTLFTKKVRFSDIHGQSHLLGLARDVTELHAVQQDLIQSNQELEHFAHIAAHDLQEPLRMVVSFAGLLKENYIDDLDGEAKEFLEYCVDGAERMELLVNDILEYSSLTTDQEDFTEVCMESVITDALLNLYETIKETDAKITHDEMPVIKSGGAVSLSRVVQNLIGNAIKYKQHEEPPVIHISVEETAFSYEFCVRDNGIGIKDVYFERIFEPFKRLHNASEYAGTGIGLASCIKIIKNHGGTMRVESKLGKGSSFCFTIAKNN